MIRNRLRIQFFWECPGFYGYTRLEQVRETVSTLMFRGYSAREALRVSFLISIPAVLGGGSPARITENHTDVLIIPGIIASFIFGLLTIKFLVKLAERINFGYFFYIDYIFY